jgi:hypothetical protein
LWKLHEDGLGIRDLDLIHGNRHLSVAAQCMNGIMHQIPDDLAEFAGGMRLLPLAGSARRCKRIPGGKVRRIQLARHSVSQ